MCLAQIPNRRRGGTPSLPNKETKVARYQPVGHIHHNRPQEIPSVGVYYPHPTLTGSDGSKPPTLLPKDTETKKDQPNLGMTAKNHKRHVAQHHYHDHANDTMGMEDMDKKRKPKGGVTVPFPLKLHNMLDEIEKDGFASVVSWQSHGRAFVVHKQKEFVEHVLPTYFRQSKFSSFQRQLNLYGFSRLFSGRDKGGYYHELFLRGKPFLCQRLVRIKIKGTEVRGGSNPETEPDFYSMPPVRLGSAAIKIEEKRVDRGVPVRNPELTRSVFNQSYTPMPLPPGLPCGQMTHMNSSFPVPYPKEIHVPQVNTPYPDFCPSQSQTSSGQVPMNAAPPAFGNCSPVTTIPNVISYGSTSSSSNNSFSTHSSFSSSNKENNEQHASSYKDDEMLRFLTELDVPFSGPEGKSAAADGSDANFGHILDQIVE